MAGREITAVGRCYAFYDGGCSSRSSREHLFLRLSELTVLQSLDVVAWMFF